PGAPGPPAPPPSAPGPSAPHPPTPPTTPPAPPPPPQRPAPASQSRAATATEERPDPPEIRATPAVRKLASEQGIDISQIEGTGLGGRVSRKDVEDFIAQRQSSQQQAAARVVPAQPQAQSQAPARQAPVPSLAGDELVPLSQMRRAIANNMVQ